MEESVHSSMTQKNLPTGPLPSQSIVLLFANGLLGCFMDTAPALPALRIHAFFRQVCISEMKMDDMESLLSVLRGRLKGPKDMFRSKSNGAHVKK